MKKHKITFCVVNPNTRTVIDQIDREVPDIFNTFDVCDLCTEQDNCRLCIVGTLQMNDYVTIPKEA